MSTDSATSTDSRAFVDASLSHVRLVSVRAKSETPATNKEGQQVQLRTDTTSGFTIGVDSVDKPSAMLVTIDFKASLKIPETENPIIQYEARHEARFEIVGWTGFSNWSDMPSDAISSYLATVHNIALRKAEEIILEMGLKGVTLPQPESFKATLVVSK